MFYYLFQTFYSLFYSELLHICHILNLSYYNVSFHWNDKDKTTNFIDFSKSICFLFCAFKVVNEKSSLTILSALLPIIISMLSILEFIPCFSSLSFYDMNLIFIDRWIFHSPYIIGLPAILPKYVLIGNFSSPLLLYSMCLWSKIPAIFFFFFSFLVFKQFLVCICFEKLLDFFFEISYRLFNRFKKMTNQPLIP